MMSKQMLRRVLAASGLAGVLLCLISGLARLGGSFFLAGIGAQSIMIAGIALMVAAMFGKQFFVDD